MIQFFFNPVAQLENETRAHVDDISGGEQVCNANKDDLDFFVQQNGQ